MYRKVIHIIHPALSHVTKYSVVVTSFQKIILHSLGRQFCHPLYNICSYQLLGSFTLTRTLNKMLINFSNSGNAYLNLDFWAGYLL